jgi:hypothetical protein
MVFITVNALHVSGGSSVHHQELKTIHSIAYLAVEAEKARQIPDAVYIDLSS